MRLPFAGMIAAYINKHEGMCKALEVTKCPIARRKAERPTQMLPRSVAVPLRLTALADLNASQVSPMSASFGASLLSISPLSSPSSDARRRIDMPRNAFGQSDTICNKGALLCQACKRTDVIHHALLPCTAKGNLHARRSYGRKQTH